MHLRNKNYNQTTKLLIFNLKLLPFLKFDDILKFYKEIKRQNLFDDNLYDIFFTYLEKNWIGYEKKTKKDIKYIKPKYPFDIWGHRDKIDIYDSNESLFHYENINKHIGFTNNVCESINSYIKTLIPINQKISLSYFCNIIQKLFLKFELKRTHREIDQERPLIINRLFTDNIIDLIKIDFNFKFIDKKKSNLIKHQYDEEKIFNINDLENTHDEDSLNKICEDVVNFNENS